SDLGARGGQQHAEHRAQSGSQAGERGEGQIVDRGFSDRPQKRQDRRPDTASHDGAGQNRHAPGRPDQKHAEGRNRNHAGGRPGQNNGNRNGQSRRQNGKRREQA
ncbi:hypothetical protein P0086_13325, partial [Mycoplana sp. MJR14]|nr:hypothetical protein [Mycoplana sp. MJR14]